MIPGAAADAAPRTAGRTVLVVLGWVLCLGGLALACTSIYDLTQTGTCASGGPYVSARPCPTGTGLKIASLFGAALLGLAGLACYAAGSRGRRASSRIGFGLLMWSLTFLGIAGAVALAAFGPDAQPDNDGARIAAVVLLVTFIPMALIPLLGAGVLGRVRRRDREEQRAAAVPLDRRAVALASSSAVAPVTGDPVDQLERLAHLKETGAIDAVEYERLKARIIGA